MDIKKVVLVLVFSLLFTGLWQISAPFPARAERSLVQNELIRVGREHYEAGEYDAAIHELSKALLMDEDNAEALKYLKKMGVDGGVYGKPGGPLGRITVLSRDVQNYQDAVTDLYQSNLSLKDVVNKQQDVYTGTLQKQKEIAQSIIDQKNSEIEEMAGWQREALANLEEQQSIVEELSRKHQAARQELVDIKSGFYQTRKDTLTATREIDEKEQEIAQMQKDLNEQQKELREQEMAYSSKLTALEEDKDALDRRLFDLEDKQYQQMQDVKREMDRKEAELQLAQFRAAAAERQASLQEARLLAANQSLRRLREAYRDLDDQFGLMQKTLAGMKRDETYRLASGRRDDRERNTLLIKHVKRQDELITDLKARLITTRDQLRDIKENQTPEQVALINELEQELERVSALMTQKEQALDEVKADYAILEGQLKDTEEQLAEVQEMVEERDVTIQQLDEHLESVDDEGVKRVPGVQE